MFPYLFERPFFTLWQFLYHDTLQTDLVANLGFEKHEKFRECRNVFSLSNLLYMQE